jgi:hypothetical protein
MIEKMVGYLEGSASDPPAAYQPLLVCNKGLWRIQDPDFRAFLAVHYNQITQNIELPRGPMHTHNRSCRLALLRLSAHPVCLQGLM